MSESTLARGSGAHVFVYGSLLDPRRLADVLGRTPTGERLRATLRAYARRSANGYAYPFIVAAPDAQVDGVVIMGLSPHDLERLDAYEEVDTGMYTRTEVEVEAWGCGPRGTRLNAYTYVAGPRLLEFVSRRGLTRT